MVAIANMGRVALKSVLKYNMDVGDLAPTFQKAHSTLMNCIMFTYTCSPHMTFILNPSWQVHHVLRCDTNKDHSVEIMLR
jgi:hypothetical protein